MKSEEHEAEIVEEHAPFAGTRVHGVTFDGERVWFARDGEIVAFDPARKEVTRRLPVPTEAGTAFDGEHLYQVVDGKILVVRPEDGRVVREIPTPGGRGRDSGLAWADGYLWIGQFRDATIHKIDPKTGEILKTLSSDRFVTGVSVVDGALWHGVSDERGCELRRLAEDGAVEEVLRLPPGAEHVSGVESDRHGGFWCGGEDGKIRRVRRRSTSA